MYINERKKKISKSKTKEYATNYTPIPLHVIGGRITKILERNRWDDKRQERGYINSLAVEGAASLQPRVRCVFEAEEKSGARGYGLPWNEEGDGSNHLRRRAKPIRHFETRPRSF